MSPHLGAGVENFSTSLKNRGFWFYNVQKFLCVEKDACGSDKAEGVDCQLLISGLSTPNPHFAQRTLVPLLPGQRVLCDVLLVESRTATARFSRRNTSSFFLGLLPPNVCGTLSGTHPPRSFTSSQRGLPTELHCRPSRWVVCQQQVGGPVEPTFWQVLPNHSRNFPAHSLGPMAPQKTVHCWSLPRQGTSLACGPHMPSPLQQSLHLSLRGEGE